MCRALTLKTVFHLLIALEISSFLDFRPDFIVIDQITGESRPYTGNYILRAVGGGLSKDTIVMYTPGEIQRFNPGERWVFEYLCA